MVANAHEIREYVVENYIQPACREGRHTIEVRLSEVSNGVKRDGERAPYYQAIKAALTTQNFQNQRNVTATENAYTSIVFTLRNTESRSRETESMTSPSPETGSKEDTIAKLTGRIDELTHDEFESLVRAYVEAKGFLDVEITFTMKMKA